MINNQNWLKSFLAILIFISTAGCAQATMHMTVNWDLSGTYAIRVQFDPYLKKFTQWSENHFKNRGYQVERRTVNGKDELYAKKFVDHLLDYPIQQDLPNANELLATFISMQTGKDIPTIVLPDKIKAMEYRKDLQMNSDLFHTHLRYTYNQLDLTSLPIDRIFQTKQRLFGGNYTPPTCSFLLTLPFAPDQSNAQKVSADGKTLTWDLRFGKNNPIIIEKDIPNPITWGILLIIALIFLIILVYSIWKEHKNK